MSENSNALKDKPTLGMIIDSSRCINCKACLVSCKVANKVPEGQWRNWIKTDPGDEDAANASAWSRRAHYQPGGCMQCAEAPCLTACPTGATYRNEADGVIMVDKGLCIGCGNCIPACPYGARFRHAVENVVDKCDFCAARRAQGLQPACVDTCITKARTFGPLDDAVNNAAKRLQNEGAQPLVDLIDIEPLPTHTKPRLRYVNYSSPDNWPEQPDVPQPMRLMTGLPGKALFGMAGLSLLGVLGMSLTQFRESRMEEIKKRNAAENCAKGADND